MKAIVNKDACIGCGQCTYTCEEVFKMEEGYAVAINPVDESVLEDCQLAADGCPTGAITIENND